MSKYIKIPIEIEAIQFKRNNWNQIQEFTNKNAINFTIEKCINGKCYCFIKTIPSEY